MHELVREFAAAPETAGIFLDFDGTLSEVVPVPADARPVPGAPDVLGRLTHAYGVVAVVSGRSAGDLVTWLGRDIEIWGTHGAERAVGGKISLSPEAMRYRDAMRLVRDEARRQVSALALEGVVIEDKSVMIGLHWRNARDRERSESALRALADRLAGMHSLVVSDTKMAVEIRPPLDFSKGDPVLARARAERLSAAMFIGDDVVDLPAFDALDELAADGVAALRVAVDSEESPDELVRRADLIVAGPAGAIALLEELAEAAGYGG
ncbi:MAG TPA: trehalose-phosphatase [Actinomycetota bacterium]|jgi:trehalose 6-phosphate phosphatase|nr:trehalose-phosphatase [Actinomycetota bacterium]